MKYLLMKTDQERYWFELDEENFVKRQIVLDEDNQLHISCLEDCLAEGVVNEADLDGETLDLTNEEFEDVWQSVIGQYKKVWEETKIKYSIGDYVEGVNSYIYPQGIVVIGKDFIAIYDGDESFCINKVVKYKVKSYDATNMWLIVN